MPGERACQGCGTPLPPKTWVGRDQKWCSDRCRKVALYSGRCIDCQAVINIDGRVRNAAERCRSCASAHRKIWTEDNIIDAIRTWAEEYGSPPTSNHWNAAYAKKHGHPQRSSRFPPATTVVNTFGTWNAGLVAAGFDPRPPGRPKSASVGR